MYTTRKADSILKGDTRVLDLKDDRTSFEMQLPLEGGRRCALTFITNDHVNDGFSLHTVRLTHQQRLDLIEMLTIA